MTGELADWYGLDAGHLARGKRADVAIIDPAGFDGSSAAYAEAPDGIVPWRERPTIFRKQSLARIPPMVTA